MKSGTSSGLPKQIAADIAFYEDEANFDMDSPTDVAFRRQHLDELTPAVRAWASKLTK
jgi:hypothetical protein